MVTTVVDNHSVKNSWDTLSKSHGAGAGAAYNVRLLCSEEDMAEGGRDSSGPQGIFPMSKRTKSEVWAYSGYCKNAQQLVENGSPIVARGGNTPNWRDHHPQQQMQDKLTLS